MTKIEGSRSGSGCIIQRHGSTDPDSNPHQNVTESESYNPVNPDPDQAVAESKYNPDLGPDQGFLKSYDNFLKNLQSKVFF